MNGILLNQNMNVQQSDADNNFSLKDDILSTDKTIQSKNIVLNIGGESVTPVNDNSIVFDYEQIYGENANEYLLYFKSNTAHDLDSNGYPNFQDEETFYIEKNGNINTVGDITAKQLNGSLGNDFAKEACQYYNNNIKENFILNPYNITTNPMNIIFKTTKVLSDTFGSGYAGKISFTGNVYRDGEDISNNLKISFTNQQLNEQIKEKSNGQREEWTPGDPIDVYFNPENNSFSCSKNDDEYNILALSFLDFETEEREYEDEYGTTQTGQFIGYKTEGFSNALQPSVSEQGYTILEALNNLFNRVYILENN